MSSDENRERVKREAREKREIQEIDNKQEGEDQNVKDILRRLLDVDILEEERGLNMIKEKYGINIQTLRKQLKKFRKEEAWVMKQEELEEKETFEDIVPEKEIENIGELKEIICKHFPSIWFEVEACLSTYCSLSLKNLNGCPSLNLIGDPSGEKTTALSFFYTHCESYLSDEFSPRSFVSHNAALEKEELSKVDLLPRIRNKVLITPELAPLFEAQRDKLVDSFAMLTRVLDGEGLTRDTGVHGRRGYEGDFKFVWLGASTPLRASVWNVMGKIGNRLFFLNLREKNRSEDDYVKMFTGKEYEQKVKICRGAVKSFLDNHFKRYPVRSVSWDNDDSDIFVLKEIIGYAKLLAKLRGTLMLWKGEDGKHEHSFPIIEQPPRAINCLRNFARGRALIHERDYLREEDLPLIKEICLSSLQHDRFQFLKLLLKYDGRLSTSTIEKELNCGQNTALATMKKFEVLEVVKQNDLPIGDGRPLRYVELKDEFKSLLFNTRSLNDGINPLSQQNNPERVEEGSSESVPSLRRVPPSPLLNEGINTLSREINPVFKEKGLNLAKAGGNDEKGN